MCSAIKRARIDELVVLGQLALGGNPSIDQFPNELRAGHVERARPSVVSHDCQLFSVKIN
jgi:hypothetical protein